jgi:hypothetical protein
MDYQIIRDIITRMHATGDKHDQRMGEMAAGRLDQLEAELACKDDAIEAARGALVRVCLQLDYLQRLWGKEGVTDGLADEARNALGVITGVAALQAADRKPGDVETDAEKG